MNKEIKAERLSRSKFYPLANPYLVVQLGGNLRTIKAQWTGEKRLPKKGECFLSGSIIEAHKATNDLSTPYHIAKVVRVVEKTSYRVVEVLK